MSNFTFIKRKDGTLIEEAKAEVNNFVIEILGTNEKYSVWREEKGISKNRMNPNPFHYYTKEQSLIKAEILFKIASQKHNEKPN
jgi:hypothetical protein